MKNLQIQKMKQLKNKFSKNETINKKWTKMKLFFPKIKLFLSKNETFCLKILKIELFFLRMEPSLE